MPPRELGLDLARSIMIGDKASDVAAGRAAGVARTIRFGPGGDPDDAEGAEGADARCGDWPAVSRYVSLLIA